MQVRVFSPRRKPITCEVGAEETFGALRARLGKELGVAGERVILLLHGEQVKDDVPASSRLEGAEEVRARGPPGRVRSRAAGAAQPAAAPDARVRARAGALLYGGCRPAQAAGLQPGRAPHRRDAGWPWRGTRDARGQPGRRREPGRKPHAAPTAGSGRAGRTATALRGPGARVAARCGTSGAVRVRAVAALLHPVCETASLLLPAPCRRARRAAFAAPCAG